MVTISVRKKQLLQLLGNGVKFKDIDELGYKLELAKVVLESHDEKTDGLALEITPDRPDLLSVYGVARALRGTLGIEAGSPKVRISDSASHKIIVEKDAAAIRPVMVGAVVEGLKLSHDGVASLFETQEKINATIGRNRKRVSFGLYDADKIAFPVRFKTADPDRTKFVPLKATSPMTLRQMVETIPKGIEYSKLVAGHKDLPILQGADGNVLGLIPIINEATSAVTEKTTRLFIENEGTDWHSCNASLAMFCQDFAEAGAKVLRCEVSYPDGRNVHTPDTKSEEMKVPVSQVNKMLGVQFSPAHVVACLAKQRIDSRAEGDFVHCEIPAYRADFLHPADLVEEVAIGNGYDNFEPLAPTAFTKGSLAPQTLREQMLRDFFVGAGYLELSTYVLTNEEKIRKAKSGEELVEVLNPVSRDYSAMRGSLLPNLLEVLSQNTHNDYPQRIFEVGEVVVPNPKLPERMETRLHACIAVAHAAASMTEAASAGMELARRLGKSFALAKFSSPQFIPGRAAEVWIDAKKAGVVGEVNPEILSGWGLQVPCSAMEIHAGK